MSQSRIHFTASASSAPVLASTLETLFEDDGYPVAAFEIDEDAGIWSVSIYVPSEEAAAARDVVLDQVPKDDKSTCVEIEELDDRNWVAETLRELAPVRAGRFIVHGSHDRGCAATNEHAILIDAAMAFGTGHHGTTAGCLDLIGRELKRRRFSSALDLGTGSGVLAIAVAKAAQIPVLATDIDPVATEIAAANARLNQVSRLVSAVTAPGFAHTAFKLQGPFDLVIANILAGPLQTMAHDLATHVDRGGSVILSGLLPHQKARIVSAYRLQGLHFVHAHYRNGWMTLLLRKP